MRGGFTLSLFPSLPPFLPPFEATRWPRSSCHDIDDFHDRLLPFLASHSYPSISLFLSLSLSTYIYNRENFSYPSSSRFHSLHLSLSLFSPNCVVDSIRVRRQGKRVLLFPRPIPTVRDNRRFHVVVITNVRRKREREDRRHLVCLEFNLDSNAY